MNRVEPIRDKALLQDMFDYLKEKNVRDAVLFATGIYTGLRVSDILLLRVRDVKDRTSLYLREKKTGKDKRIKFNKFLLKLYEEYTANKKEYECLFPGKERVNKAITRQQAYNILNDAAAHVGLVDGIGTHTMRKTFGYHYYKKTKDVATLMIMFNHKHPSVTLRYIGITQDDVEKVYADMDLLS